jgi:hypothetical protein
LLSPTYFYLDATVRVKQARLASIEATVTTNDEKALSARLGALSSNAAKLIALANAPSASSVLREMLNVPRTGIKLSGFSYSPAVGKSLATLIVVGTASTREALRNYQLQLEQASFASAATLPVSAYAKDANIDFTITVTLKP